MKDILTKLANGINDFKCQWNGEPNECQIVQIDFEQCKALVNFKTPVKKTISVVDEDITWGLEPDFDGQYKDVEVESSQEWISLSEYSEISPR
tara:strand:- start:456 stop:734 length:279 start_codon:yes stop_codon:yes gene_type:complete